MILFSIGIGSLFRTGVTAMLDSMGSTFPKAAVAALEDKGDTKAQLARQCLIDEGPEVFWKTIAGSLFVKTMRIVAPAVPEQIANFPGEMMGALFHWLSAAPDAKSREGHRAAAKNSGEKHSSVEEFFLKYINKPIKFALETVGLGEKKVNFYTFGIINACLFAGGAYVLKGAEEENIPGMNLDYEDPWYVSLFKTAGYTVFEQVAHITSQTMRYCIDLKKEFKGKDVFAKALANVLNERAIPGNIPSAISGCLSTLFLGRYIPKPVAGALGEAPMKGLERLLTIRRKRATKDRYDESFPDKRAPNFRGHDKEWFVDILEAADLMIDKVRDFLIKNVVVKIFKPSDKTAEQFAKELLDSCNLRIDILKNRTEEQDEITRQREIEMKKAG